VSARTASVTAGVSTGGLLGEAHGGIEQGAAACGSVVASPDDGAAGGLVGTTSGAVEIVGAFVDVTAADAAALAAVATGAGSGLHAWVVERDWVASATGGPAWAPAPGAPDLDAAVVPWFPAWHSGLPVPAVAPAWAAGPLALDLRASHGVAYWDAGAVADKIKKLDFRAAADLRPLGGAAAQIGEAVIQGANIGEVVIAEVDNEDSGWRAVATGRKPLAGTAVSAAVSVSTTAERGARLVMGGTGRAESVDPAETLRVEGLLDVRGNLILSGTGERLAPWAASALGVQIGLDVDLGAERPQEEPAACFVAGAARASAFLVDHSNATSVGSFDVGTEDRIPVASGTWFAVGSSNEVLGLESAVAGVLGELGVIEEAVRALEDLPGSNAGSNADSNL